MQRSALCRSRRELSNAYFLAKFDIDTAENEPCQVCLLCRCLLSSAGDLEGVVVERLPGRGAIGVGVRRHEVLREAELLQPVRAEHLGAHSGSGAAWVGGLAKLPSFFLQIFGGLVLGCIKTENL